MRGNDNIGMNIASGRTGFTPPIASELVTAGLQAECLYGKPNIAIPITLAPLALGYFAIAGIQ